MPASHELSNWRAACRWASTINTLSNHAAAMSTTTPTTSAASELVVLDIPTSFDRHRCLTVGSPVTWVKSRAGPTRVVHMSARSGRPEARPAGLGHQPADWILQSLTSSMRTGRPSRHDRVAATASLSVSSASSGSGVTGRPAPGSRRTPRARAGRQPRTGRGSSRTGRPPSRSCATTVAGVFWAPSMTTFALAPATSVRMS